MAKVQEIQPCFRKTSKTFNIFYDRHRSSDTSKLCTFFSLAFKSIFISFEVKKQLKMIHMTCQCFNKFNASVTKSKILFLPSLENSLEMVFGSLYKTSKCGSATTTQPNTVEGIFCSSRKKVKVVKSQFSLFFRPNFWV